MIEQGISMLVQGDAAVSALANKGGGFAVTLPKDFDLKAAPSWTYQVVSDNPEITLIGIGGFSRMRLQIDVFASTADAAIRLAKAIGNVLEGYIGDLPDPDSTRVTACYPSAQMDFFDSDPRTFRRMLEFEVQYAR